MLAVGEEECSASVRLLQAKADKCVDVLCSVQLLGSMSFAVLMQAQTGLVYRLARGNTELAIQVVSNVSSASSLLAFLISPALGRLSDTYGRKPFISIFPLLVAVLRSATAINPGWGTLILGQLLTATTAPVFFASIQAAVADTHLPLGGSAIAVATARIQTWMGVAMMLGPLLGGQLSAIDLRLPFAASAAFGAVNVLWLQNSFDETRSSGYSSGSSGTNGSSGSSGSSEGSGTGTPTVRKRKATGVMSAVVAAAVKQAAVAPQEDASFWTSARDGSDSGCSCGSVRASPARGDEVRSGAGDSISNTFVCAFCEAIAKQGQQEEKPNSNSSSTHSNSTLATRKRSWLANPLSFLKLFRGSAVGGATGSSQCSSLATLAAISGLQVLSGEGALRDVERLYTRNQLGWDAEMDGWFLSAQGCVSIVGGRVCQGLLHQLGQVEYTMIHHDTPYTIHHTHYTHTLCTLYALSMHSLCTLYALTMHSLCTHHALTMHSPCTHYALAMHSPCSHYTRWSTPPSPTRAPYCSC
jgi:hypothetical protein